MSSARTPGGGGKGVQAAWLGGQLADRPIGQILLAVAVTLAALPLILQLITRALERPYALFIDANSETLQLTTQGNAAASWYLADATILYAATELPAAEHSLVSLTPPAAAITGHFRGCLDIGPHTRVTLRRQGREPLRITIEGRSATASEAPPAALLRPVLPTGNAMGSAPCAEPHQAVALQRLTLEASIDRQPLNGALQGRGRIGGAPYFTNLAESPPLLRHGQAVVMGRRLLSERAYPLMETPLYLGDTVRVIDVEERGANPAPEARQSGAEQVPPDAGTSVLTCLFSVEGEAMDGSGIEVACHARGQALAIGRYGDRSRDDLAPRPWDVLINEPSMQAILPLTITGLFILVIRLLDMLYPRLCRRLARVGDVRRR